MPGNVLGTVDVPTALFLGLNTEISPGDLPEGCSPDCQDVAFLPGSVFSRPCLHKLYSSVGTATFTYMKTFVQANGQPLTLALDSNGILYKEDVTNNFGILTQIGSVTPGSYCTSVTFGTKEYLAFHDGLHGTDIPRQFDGTNFDRVSQDGPAAPVTAADLSSTVNITSIVGAAALTIASISESGTIVTVITTTAHGLTGGDPVYLGVLAGSSYNGSYFVQSVPNSTTFTVNGLTGGITATTGGTVQPNLVTVTTATAHGLQVIGDQVTIAGSASDNYNNGKTITTAVSQVSNAPASWTVSKITSATAFVMSVNVGVPGSTASGTVSVGGLISPGVHQVVCMFLTRQGYITAPSQPASWTCGGGKQASITNIPIGPSNVIARILAFTGAGGGNYFWIPTNVPSGAIATIINDNTTASVTVDFADNTLFAATAIDIQGNNLFAQVVLAPVLGVFSYASRLFWWGEVNKVQNFLNMGFEGGILSGAPTAPLGWSVITAGGLLVTNPVNFGDAWQITGDGTASAKGQIQQSAYQDVNKIPIIEPNTLYTFRAWAKASANLLAGNLIATLSSVSTAFTSTATISVTSITTSGAILTANFDTITPATIPSDLVLNIFTKSTPNAATVTIDENEIAFTLQPYRENDFRVSYVNNPEAYDGVTGDLGPASDPSPIRCAGIIRNSMYILTADRLHATQDNTQEPSFWNVPQIADQCGAFSSMCVDSGSDWLVWASDQGIMISEGAGPAKLSQEIQPDWNSINVAVQQRIWLVNDQIAKRIYIGLPTGAHTAPNLIYPMDYRELDSQPDISQHGSVRVSYTGKMIASDLARKWTRWNLPMLRGAVISRSGNSQQFVFGAGNGSAPGSGTSFGNIYFLDSAKLADDDYGQMFPYYVSYGFVNHDAEQALQVGSHRKLYDYISFFITGVGTVTITLLGDSLTNAYPVSPTITMSASQAFDIGFPINVDANRAFVKFVPAPLANTTPVQFNLQKLVLDLKPHPISPVR